MTVEISRWCCRDADFCNHIVARALNLLADGVNGPIARLCRIEFRKVPATDRIYRVQCALVRGQRFKRLELVGELREQFVHNRNSCCAEYGRLHAAKIEMATAKTKSSCFPARAE